MLLNRLFPGLALLPLAFATPAHAEEWTYTDAYPYVWTSSNNTWLYLPPTTQIVYDYTAETWVLNPWDSRAFDLETFMTQEVLAGFNLKVEGGSSEYRVDFDPTVDGRGTITKPGSSAGIPCTLHIAVDALSAKAVLFGHIDAGANSDGTESFSVTLDFEGATGGRFVLMGHLGGATGSLTRLSGVFTPTLWATTH